MINDLPPKRSIGVFPLSVTRMRLYSELTSVVLYLHLMNTLLFPATISGESQVATSSAPFVAASILMNVISLDDESTNGIPSVVQLGSL